jgi:hypothetical protein
LVIDAISGRLHNRRSRNDDVSLSSKFTPPIRVFQWVDKSPLLAGGSYILGTTIHCLVTSVFPHGTSWVKSVGRRGGGVVVKLHIRRSYAIKMMSVDPLGGHLGLRVGGYACWRIWWEDAPRAQPSKLKRNRKLWMFHIFTK